MAQGTHDFGIATQYTCMWYFIFPQQVACVGLYSIVCMGVHILHVFSLVYFMCILNLGACYSGETKCHVRLRHCGFILFTDHGYMSRPTLYATETIH